MALQELVLLVNDIPDQASAYAAALTRDGYRVQLVTSGHEALGVVASAVPDCAVIDLRLPDMTGWELCQTLRAREDCRDLRLVVLTPDVSRMAAEDSAKLGCNAWLMHPSAADDLVRTVRQVLSLESTEPVSSDGAVLSLTLCPACGSEGVRPTLRVSAIQYYCCQNCRFCWRVEVLTSSRHSG
jgi:two-component system, OmpR family, phosphate regulon response regulator PhoB